MTNLSNENDEMRANVSPSVVPQMKRMLTSPAIPKRKSPQEKPSLEPQMKLQSSSLSTMMHATAKIEDNHS